MITLSANETAVIHNVIRRLRAPHKITAIREIVLNRLGLLCVPTSGNHIDKQGLDC